MAKAIQKIDDTAAASAEVVKVDPALSIIERFLVDPSVPVERVNQAFEFYQKMRADQARRAFDAAMANAKAEIPPIFKNREVDFTSQKGRTNYRHEDLSEIARTVDPILAKHGLSYRYRTSSELNEPVRVTCVVSHRDGHSEENALCGGRDESGNKNAIQSIGSTITYLQRYALKAALGLAASNDDDGKAASAPEIVTEDQAIELRDWIEATSTDEKAFLTYFKAESVSAFPAAKYDVAIAAFKKKGQRS